MGILGQLIIFKTNCIKVKMDAPPPLGAHSSSCPRPLPALSLNSLASVCFYILPVTEWATLCPVSYSDPPCNAPHFVYQWTFQPKPARHLTPPPLSLVSYLLLSRLLFLISTPFNCYILVARHSKQKAFCIEKETTIIFFIPLSNNKISVHRYRFTKDPFQGKRGGRGLSLRRGGPPECVCV